MIVFIADIVHHTLANITCSCAALVYRGKTSIDSIYGFRTPLPTEIWKMAAWLLAKDRFSCPTNIREVSSKFPSCLIVALMINLQVEDFIYSD